MILQQYIQIGIIAYVVIVIARQKQTGSNVVHTRWCYEYKLKIISNTWCVRSNIPDTMRLTPATRIRRTGILLPTVRKGQQTRYPRRHFQTGSPGICFKGWFGSCPLPPNISKPPHSSVTRRSPRSASNHQPRPSQITHPLVCILPQRTSSRWVQSVPASILLWVYAIMLSYVEGSKISGPAWVYQVPCMHCAVNSCELNETCALWTVVCALYIHVVSYLPYVYYIKCRSPGKSDRACYYSHASIVVPRAKRYLLVMMRVRRGEHTRPT